LIAELRGVHVEVEAHLLTHGALLGVRGHGASESTQLA
jgi:hypothetical protein